MQLQDVPALRSYLTTRLVALYVLRRECSWHVCRSDADPAALADYIIALLKHEKPPAELKAFCTDQLGDFLHENTGPFVESLFRRMEGNGGADDDGPREETVVVGGGDDNNRMRDDSRLRDDNRMRDDSNTVSPYDRRTRDDGGAMSYDRMMRDDSLPDEDERDSRRRDHDSRRRSRSPPYYREDRRGRREHGEYRRDSMRGRTGPPPPHFRAPRPTRYARERVQNAPREMRSATRLVIDKIPLESCSIAAVNEYFSRFGKIVNITVQPEIQRARLDFETAEQANAAYTCPEVIFGNRFVKVYWDADEGAVGRPASVAAPSSAVPPRVEALHKRQEALRGMLELQRQKQELQAKYIAEQKELLGRLESKTLSDPERQEITRTLGGIDELIRSLMPPAPVKNGSAAAEASSASAPTSAPASTSAPVSAPILRGGPMRGRGRGGAFASRVAHRLDLRPTALTMKPIPSRVGREAGSIRKLFGPYGEIADVALAEEGAGAVISFARRADAEKALFHVAKTDLGEPFSLNWAQSGSGTAATASPTMMAVDAAEGGDGASPGEGDMAFVE